MSPLATINAVASTQAAAKKDANAEQPPAAAATNRKLLVDPAPAPKPAEAEQPAAQSQLDPNFAIAEGSSANVSATYGDALAMALAGDLTAYEIAAYNQVGWLVAWEGEAVGL